MAIAGHEFPIWSAVKQMEGGSNILGTIFQYGWLMLVAIGGWMLRRIVFLEAEVRVLHANNKASDEARRVLAKSMDAQFEALHRTNEQVLDRIASIDGYLRDHTLGKNGS